MTEAGQRPEPFPGIVRALGEEPIFGPGDSVRVANRAPVGHYRVPIYLRGKQALVEAVIEPASIDNEEEAFGRHAGSRRHYYRIAVPLADLWRGYRGSAKDGLRIEVFESWLEKA